MLQRRRVLNVSQRSSRWILYALYKHVIYIHFDVSPNLWGKHLVYKPLVCCPCILQSEWHDFVAEESLPYDK